MKNTKLYTLLSSFDKYEQNRLRKYLSSPYFNRDESLVELYEVFIKHINNGSEKEMTKDFLWSRIKKDKSFNDTRLRKYLSDLLKLVEGYVIQQKFEESPINRTTYLLEAIGERKIEKLYNSAVKSARDESRKFELRNADYYFHQYDIEKKYYDLTEFELNRSSKSNIEALGLNLDSFYLAEKLKYYCAILTQKNFVAHEYEFPLIEEITGYLQNIPSEDLPPPVAIYYLIYLTLTNTDNDDNYYKLKNSLNRFGLLFPKQEARETLYMAALNFCARRINKGHKEFMTELFLLYKDLLEKEIIIYNSELNPWYFKNIISVSLRIGEFDWAENFIKEYNSYLPEDLRKNAVTYNLGLLFFYQKRYEKVIEQLRDVEYDDPSYNIDSKTMLIATYYELDEIEPLDSLFESFRVYLNRHQDISLQSRKRYMNLIKFTKKLTRIPPNDKKALNKLNKEIDESEGVVSVRWLKEKIQELL